MNELQRGIITLLKSAISREPGVLPEGFLLEEAIPVIRKHQLQPLVYEGARYCGIPDSVPQMVQLFRVYCKHMVRSEAQMKMVEKLYAAFDANGIDYMPLKGCNMKALYPRPELRVMGDADILIRTEQYPRIGPIVEKLGMEEQRESDHEFIWKSEELNLELHKRLIPSYNSDYYAYFGDGWRLARKQNGCQYAMTPEDGFVYQVVHYAKHYRDGGIGCRHIVDLWVYRRAHPQMDMDYISAELEKLQLREFYDNTSRLIALWFENGEADERTAFMTDIIFDSGSWGRKKDHVLSAEARGAEMSGSLLIGRLRYICLMLFPTRKSMMPRYPALKRLPWLLPFMWIRRWLEVVLFRREAVSRKRKELQSATADRVEEYQKSLAYVGLAFRFDVK